MAAYFCALLIRWGLTLVLVPVSVDYIIDSVCVFLGSRTFHEVPEWRPGHRSGSGRWAEARTTEEI